MAGRGPAPKPQAQRRNRAKPARGEWVDLEPLDKPVLGAADGSWSPRVRRLWVAWREDPVSGSWSRADVAAVFELADQFEELAPNEQRLRMDGLGLTPKGKRDLRLRYAESADVVAPALAVVKPIKMKDPRVA
jgi:hypothetical protein